VVVVELELVPNVVGDAIGHSVGCRAVVAYSKAQRRMVSPVPAGPMSLVV
jgi:hypothetical protein